MVEIASPSTKVYDRTREMEIYAAYGVADYWIVTPDLDKPDVTAFTLEGKRYRQDAFAAGGDRFTVARPFPVSFTPLELVDTGEE